MNINSQVSLEKFCKYYNIKIKSNRRKIPVFEYATYPFFDYNDKLTAAYDNVTVFELEIPESALVNLIELDSKIQYYQKKSEMFQQCVDEYRDIELREQEIRDHNPGVQKAYENYQLLLKLAKGNSDNGC